MKRVLYVDIKQPRCPPRCLCIMHLPVLETTRHFLWWNSFLLKTSQEKKLQFSIRTGPSEPHAGKSSEEHKSNSNLLTRANGRTKFGWEEKASEQRNPHTQSLLSAKKVKKRKIVSAQLRFADCLQSTASLLASTKGHRKESPSSSLGHFWGWQRNFCTDEGKFIICVTGCLLDIM